LGGIIALILEPVAKTRLELESLRVQQRLENLQVRGTSYPEHHWELVSFVVGATGALLQAKCGFSAEEFVSTFRAAEEQIEQRIQAAASFMREVERVQAETFAGLDDEAAAFASEEEAARLIVAAVPEEGRRHVQEKFTRVFSSGRGLLAVDVSDPRVSRAVLQACSSAPGENAAFFTKGEGRPDAETIIWSKPFVRIEDEFFCASPLTVNRSPLSVLDGLLLRGGAHQERYQRIRAKCLEDRAVAHLTKLLPGVSPPAFFRVNLTKCGHGDRCTSSVPSGALTM